VPSAWSARARADRPVSTGPQTHHPSAIECFESFRDAAGGKLLTVFLDYDGTISPIVKQPDKAFMSDEMRAAVRRVASLYPTAIISGRSREKVYDFVRLPELYYAGSHGLDIVAPVVDGGARAREMHQPAPWAPAVMDAVYKECVEAIESIPGASVDHNKFCVSVHYRNCEAKEDWTRVKAVVDRCVAADPARLRRAEGRKVFEVKPRVAWDKGKALSYLLGQLGLEGKYAPGEVMSLYFGDDHTDEDAFHELRGFPGDAGCGVIVSTVPKPSVARYSVRDPAEVLTFLNSIADLAENGWTKSLDTAATINGKGSGGG
jgi:trehalose 6-phosphate phosphatase